MLDLSLLYTARLYIVDPSKQQFEKLSDVPNYIGQATPYFVSTILAEAVVTVRVFLMRKMIYEMECLMLLPGLFQTILYYHEKDEEARTGKAGTLAAGKPLRLPRLNDSIASMSAGLFMVLAKIILRSVEARGYIWTFENMRIMTLNHKSIWTWIIGFLGVDFGYYWFHRHAHEVHPMYMVI